MGSEKPHAVLIPYPAQGHINPMLKLAKLLHSRGFYITFIHTEFNHRRLLRSRGSDSFSCLDDFSFETIPDGLPPSNRDATQDVAALCHSTRKTCLGPFRNLVTKLNNTIGIPQVSCIIADGAMAFTLPVANELHIPEVLFWTTSACGFLCYLYYRELIERGFTPLTDESYLTNGYLDTRIDWLSGLKDIRLRDFPTFIRTTDPDDIMLNFVAEEAQKACKASAVVLNTFDDMEHDVLDAMRRMLPHLYTVGPLSLQCNKILDSRLNSIGSSLWKEEDECLEWLDKKKPGSVVYVNFGSITVISAEQLKEFAWGLANSNHLFLWVIRPDLVAGDAAMLPQEFIKVTHERGLLASWCPQEKVLSHPSIGGFLTHCGWNSMIESVSEGVPVICWPFFAEQQTNCRFACTDWGIGMEIDNDVRRDGVEGLVRELMDGEKGKIMRKKTMEWKMAAKNATKKGGSSYMNLEKLISEVLCAVKC
ncbi:7-deoxyloganetin glucosyltransferase-like [Magnolia sinica]|uniref:7-deoxyloganetin glucosyltransferase-like n=1 Tax=Magnolia sinica TaxID=86752 RepID=UPI002658C68E|nr:7-deoxyloganetin glucosyltransferase-like [Magnolia sinica]